MSYRGYYANWSPDAKSEFSAEASVRVPIVQVVQPLSFDFAALRSGQALSSSRFKQKPIQEKTTSAGRFYVSAIPETSK
jgi:hypothetical protein